MAIDDDTVTPGELPAIAEDAIWEEHLPAVVTGVKVRGGDDGKGAANFQARVLDKRTRYLKQEIASLVLNGLDVKGTLNSQAELDALPTEDLPKGIAYFVEGSLRVWNLEEWVDSGSLLGPRGITLLGTWPDANELPAPESNTVGDAYVWKSDIWLLIPQPDGWVSIGLKGPEGRSAYQSAVDNGFQGTQPQWLATLVGKSAYQVWRDAGNVGSQNDFLASLNGKDAYQLWLLDEDNEGKTIEEFFEAFRGKAGINWRGNYSEGSGYAFGDAVTSEGSSYVATRTINGVKPGPGVQGWSVLAAKGDKGDPAVPFSVMGSKATVDELPRPGSATQAWYVGSTLWVWVTDLTDYVDLDGIGGLSAYELAKQEGFNGTLQQWLVSLKGESAYQLAVADGYPGTLQQWLASLRGASSYQIWVSQGNTGDEDAFLASLKSTEPGPRGFEGPAKAPFKVMGTKATEAALPTPGKEDEAWFVGKNLYVWVEAETQYADIGSMGGISAYDVAVENGFEGTVTQWLASLKSTEEGPIGPRGGNLVVKGTVATAAVLETISNPADNDAYVTNNDGHLHTYLSDTTEWVDLGPFRGTDGQSAYQIWLANDHTGSEQEFLSSLKGKDGVSVIIRGSVVTFEELPANPQEQWVYAVRDVNSLYCRIGNAWVLLGEFRGEDGEDGANGTSIAIIKVLTEADQTIPGAGGANEGKAYISLDKHIMLSVNGVWTDGGPVGAPGDRGETGTGIKLRGTVATVASLPSKVTAEEGDGYFTSVDKKLYVLTDGEWAGPFDIIGPQGEGLPGPEGAPGKSINIMGAFDTIELLAAAHPTGTLGDGYLIGTGETPRELAIWSTEGGGQWINVGLIQGPPGKQGERGPIGVGKQGEKGPRGSMWITLPAGQDAPAAGFTGVTGDWAVSESFKVYYKSADKGWQYWGQLVAGDVNSPMQSLGKVVRLGNEWVPLLVDEAPEMVDGRLYVRQLIDGSTDNEGEWVELIFPESFDEPAADGRRYVRTRATGQTKGTWSLLPVYVAEAPDDGKLYGRRNPTGGDTPAGTDAVWEEIKTIADVTTKDGELYARSFATDGTTPVWKKFTLPATIADLQTKDGKQYARVYETAGQAPIWKEIVAPVFDRYSVKLLAATAELDLSVCQTFSINASVARTLTFKAGTVPAADRSMVVVLIVNGAGTITWPSTITWHQNAIPVLGATSTIITLVWDGIGIGAGGRWLGSAGATV